MTLTAQYHGVCADCLDPILPGERIDGEDGEWRHARCGALPEKVQCVCERCFLVHVGECL